MFCIQFLFPEDDQMGKSHDFLQNKFLVYTLFIFIKQLKSMFGHVTVFLLGFLITSFFLGVTLGLKPGSLVKIDPTHANTYFEN